MTQLRSTPNQAQVLLRAGAWGVVAAMAMSGMRTVTTGLGLVGATPPEAMAEERAGALLARVPPSRRQAAVEIGHWGFGALVGATVGVLPRGVRRRAWAGPGFGLLVWLGFEAILAPALGLSGARATKLRERAALAADHLLYGMVLARSLERRDS